MTDLQEGELAPEFTLPRSGGNRLSLRDLRGKKIVLYFYPKDDTSGCTKEACSFRDLNQDFESAGAVVLGVSPDGVASHDRFAAKYDLPFVLLSDPDHAVADQYGVWVEKSMYGKKYMGIDRSTFLIDEDGTLKHIWRNVKPEAHANQVLSALKD